MARHFKQLIVWQLAEELSAEVYRLIGGSPAKRDFKFRDQLQDAVNGIGTQIADGFPRGATDFARFITYSESCLRETENHLNDGVLRKHWTLSDLTTANALVRRLTRALREFLIYLQSEEAQRRSREFRARRQHRRENRTIEPKERVEPVEPDEPDEPAGSI